MAGAAGQIHRDRIQGSRDHLASDGTFPDQFVQRVLIGVEMSADRFRRHRHHGWADRLVCLLGILGLGLEQPGTGRQILRTVALGDQDSNFVEGVLGQIDRVGAHVGDQTHCAVAGVDTLVQLLGDPHGALGGEAQLARGFLLQGGGGEGRGGVTLALLALDPRHAQPADGGAVGSRRTGLGELGARGGQQRPLHGVRLFGIDDAELGQLGAIVLDQPGGERLTRLGGVGLQRPVLPGLKAFDLLLALDDHPQRRRLHPAGGQSRAGFSSTAAATG